MDTKKRNGKIATEGQSHEEKRIKGIRKAADVKGSRKERKARNNILLNLHHLPFSPSMDGRRSGVPHDAAYAG